MEVKVNGVSSYKVVLIVRWSLDAKWSLRHVSL